MLKISIVSYLTAGGMWVTAGFRHVDLVPASADSACGAAEASAASHDPVRDHNAVVRCLAAC